MPTSQTGAGPITVVQPLFVLELPLALVIAAALPVPDGAALAGPQLVRLFDDLSTVRLPTWAWPLPGGVSRWRRIAREVTGGRWPCG
ncbi:hypothetical protein AB0H23_34605 [Streptomyces albogriseolus]|uniref:hypothetical protein n=1 Tax=Streptomyces albogriseolus TaxID=1887 RepID=UPI003460F90F